MPEHRVRRCNVPLRGSTQFAVFAVANPQNLGSPACYGPLGREILPISENAHNVIRVNKSMCDQQVGSPKSKHASRWINVKPYVMQMLKEHLKGRTEGLVFQSRRPTPLQNCTVLHKHLHPLLRQLAIEQGGMHPFRHHRVSTLVMAGTPLVVIRKGIGHGSEQMVERYTHLRPDFMRDELARVPDFVRKPVRLTLLTLKKPPLHNVSSVFAAIPGWCNR